MKTHQETVRVHGRLKRVVTLTDESGKVIHRFLQPFMVEFYPRDAMQIIVGATILAIPVAFTEETWVLGSQISTPTALAFLALSWSFIAAFVFYNYYRKHFSAHKIEFVKRVLSTYIIAFGLVTLVLALIGKAPWLTDPSLAFNRSVIVTLPASLSGAISDVIK